MDGLLSCATSGEATLDTAAAGQIMHLEFSSVQAFGSSCVEFPRGWVGTTAPVRVSADSTRVNFSLGLRPWSGKAAHGIFQASERFALVVDKGTGYWFQERDGGALLVAPARMWPILEVVEAPPHLALVSAQEIELLSHESLFGVPVFAVDGFRNVLLSGGRISGEAWTNGEWRAFAFDVSDLTANRPLEISWVDPCPEGQ